MTKVLQRTQNAEYSVSLIELSDNTYNILVVLGNVTTTRYYESKADAVAYYLEVENYILNKKGKKNEHYT